MDVTTSALVDDHVAELSNDRQLNPDRTRQLLDDVVVVTASVLNLFKFERQSVVGGATEIDFVEGFWVVLVVGCLERVA
ncbi:hypothetical protein QYF36_023870 [Acer negundo]|nr:hypothetical protein QYF36_023870 [Acer negundo]